MKQLPMSVNDFSRLIASNCVYVDKTQLIYNMIMSTQQYYFLSRPRRFGKTLLISILRQLFAGNKFLFKNLWIVDSNYDWQTYPVIHLDFSEISHETKQELKDDLGAVLDKIAAGYNIDLTSSTTPISKFRTLIGQLSQINRVIVLIDEYDKPILDNIGNKTEAKAQREFLQRFYAVIKASDERLRFVMLTGITKFAHMTIFSGLNNLTDISLDKRYATLLGYTQQELIDNFSQYIESIAHEYNKTSQTMTEELRKQYDGYQFSENSPRLFNPYSILNCFDTKKLSHHWFASATPSFLIHTLQTVPYTLATVNRPSMSEAELSAFEIEDVSLASLLFQAGYLTISDYDPESQLYTLDFPNNEVRRAFGLLLASSAISINTQNARDYAKDLTQALRINDMALLCRTIQGLVNKIPYDMQPHLERDIQALLFGLFLFLRVEIDSEVKTARGRADLVVTIPHRVYIIELKLNKPASSALKQIHDQEYYEMFMGPNIGITLVGIGLNQKTKKVSIKTANIIASPAKRRAMRPTATRKPTRTMAAKRKRS